MKKVQKILFFIILLLGNAVFAQNNVDLLIIGKNYTEAIGLIENEIKLNPSAELYFKKGLVFESLQNYSEAIIAFKTAEQFDYSNLELAGEIAECNAILGNYFEAKDYFEKAISCDAENSELKAKAGRNYINLKDFRKAFNCFSEIYKKDSTNIYWNKQLAFCAFRVGKRKQAIELYSKVLDANPRDYSTYLNLAKLYEKGKEDSLIEKVYRNGITEFPDDTELREEFARYYFEMKKYDMAKENYEIYFSLKGDSVYPVLLNYGISLYFAANEQLSVNILEKCVSINVNDPFALFYLALNYKKLRDFQMAEQYIQASIEAATPAYLPDMYHHLGQIFGLQRKFPESITAFQKTLELDPENKEVLFEIATTYEEYNSNKTLALNYYSIYLKESGENGKNIEYALTRYKKLKEDLFFDK